MPFSAQGYPDRQGSGLARRRQPRVTGFTRTVHALFENAWDDEIHPRKKIGAGDGI